jgi:predicted glycoside hydrolase/deacetylase ChbG (UPF0249 family)
VRNSPVDSVAVIVNADDLGIAQAEADGVREGLASGRITSATLMANGTSLPQALEYVRAFPQCSFGVHLNLTYGFPVSAGSAARLLIDDSGRMSREVFATLRPTAPVLRAVYAEWCAQVELLFAKGVDVSHLDSHHHVHTVPFLFPVLKAVQKRFRVRRVRISKNIYAPGEPCGLPLKIAKGAYNFSLRTVYSTRTVGGFTDLATFCEVARRGRLRYRTVEIMVHPKALGGEAEDALLHSDWESRLPFSVSKIHYGQL